MHKLWAVLLFLLVVLSCQVAAYSGDDDYDASGWERAADRAGKAALEEYEVWEAAGETNPPEPTPDFDLSGLPAYRVTAVVDGDTIKVEVNGEEYTVRLIGVDTPETVHPSKPVEEFGLAASAFTKNLLSGEYVYLLTDRQTTLNDRYGRTLAYVFRVPDGLFVNLEIIRQGYGHAYTRFPFDLQVTFSSYEKRAREIGKGLWADEEEEVELEPLPVPSYSKPTTTSSSSSSSYYNQSKSQEAEEEEDDSGSDYTVYITRTGSKYHRSGCRYLSRSCIPISLSDAIASGYGA